LRLIGDHMQYLSHLHYSRLREKGFILCAQWRMPSNEMQVLFIYSQLMPDKSDSIVSVLGKKLQISHRSTSVCGNSFQRIPRPQSRDVFKGQTPNLSLIVDFFVLQAYKFLIGIHLKSIPLLFIKSVTNKCSCAIKTEQNLMS
jgi:hypothetical protein